MVSIKNIVVATDFSGPAHHAAERGAMLARQHGAKLRLVHVMSDGALARLHDLLGLDVKVEHHLFDEARHQIDNLAEEMTRAGAPLVEKCLLHGAVLDEIGKQTELFKADLLVLAARGSSVLRRLALGATAERLLHKSMTPLLVVKQPASKPYARVLLPVDFSEESFKAIRLARRVAPDAHLVFLHACEVPFAGKLRRAGVEAVKIDRYRESAMQTAIKEVRLLAEHAGLDEDSWSDCIVFGGAALGVVEQEKTQQCDLIVIGKHGRDMTKDMLLGSVTRLVLAESFGDVLVSTSPRMGPAAASNEDP